MNHQDNFDFAIMTAVDDEHEAVLKAFKFCHKDKVLIENRIYWQKNIQTKLGNNYSLVVAQSLDMANVSSAILANNIIHHFHPKVIFLVGVCAGRENKVEKGDILLAEEVYYYERGKQTEKGFEPEPKMHSADAGLIDFIRNLPKTTIPNCKTHDGSMKRPKMVRGVIGCGEKVIEDPESWNQLLQHHRKIVAIEMESHGLASAIWEYSQDSKFIVIKAVMDYGVPPKDDRWKPFAAKAAALYIKNIINNDPFYSQNGIAQKIEENKLPPKGKLANHGNLPLGSRLEFIRNSNFTGRESDLMELANHFLYRPKEENNSEVSSIFLTSGIGGIGKTQLAIEFCFRYGRFFQGIHWIQADQDVEPQIADCGYRMGLTPWPEKLSDQVNSTIRTWEADNNRLIIFDNLESSEVLQKWIPRMRGIMVLATSRRDQWPSEMNIRTLPINVLNNVESREFLRNIAPRLNKVDDQVVDILSDRLGYLPLALYIAANYLNERKTFSVEQFLKELDERGKGISHTALSNWQQKIGPTHHVQNIIATFDMSWALLGESIEDKAAKIIAVAAGYCAPNIPIPPSIFYGLEEEGNKEIIEKALNRLYQVGLLILGSQSFPYIHSLITEYTRLQIGSSKDLKKIISVFVVLSHNALSTKLPELMYPYLEHMKQIIFWTDNGDFPEIGIVCGNLGIFFRQLTQFKDSLFYLEDSLEITTNNYGEDHPIVAICLKNLAAVLQDIGDPVGAKQRIERALEIDINAYGKDHPEVATDLNILVGISRQLGDLVGAMQHFERALEITNKSYGNYNLTDDIGRNNYLADVHKDLSDLREIVKDEQSLLINLVQYDQSTGVLRWKDVHQRLKSEVLRSVRYKRDLSLILMVLMLPNNKDISGRKLTTLEGQIIEVILNNLRKDLDILFIGEKIGIILPETTETSAQILALRLIDKIFRGLRAEVAVGIASVPKDAVTEDKLFDQAELALRFAISSDQSVIPASRLCA
ncbi:tetratricopeptide repeat protein [Pelolinea submarina]|uniref:Nucleoside phosphorylase n=1 Tax=Pelolinea submarina TaxID=913107 RepID=A0A347ZQE8_9CHLR|nr:tetratricopeptide repeat protein [Pelolinea submarina]REG06141.1 nucleoside phosphorylase [Pelolinea submarina]BBB47529.1 hypothetical protein Pelsub_P0756 [Pelolinea submarina]